MKKRFDGFDEDGAAEDKAEERKLEDPDVNVDPEEEDSEGITYFTVRFPGESPFPSKSGIISVNSQKQGLTQDQNPAGFTHSKKPLAKRIHQIRSGVGSIFKKFRK